MSFSHIRIFEGVTSSNLSSLRGSVMCTGAFRLLAKDRNLSCKLENIDEMNDTVSIRVSCTPPDPRSCGSQQNHIRRVSNREYTLRVQYIR